MDVTDISPQLDQLDGDLDRLEDALQPIIKDLGGVASKLPLLDKAKLYVLATYSIESTMYSALRLNGADAKAHPIMKELTRVRQYFEKIKKAEEPPAERTQSVDTQAAIRFIKADLADNPETNNKLKEQLAKERAKAALKAAAAKGDRGKKRSAEESGGASVAEGASVDTSVASSSAEEVQEPEKKKSKKSKSGKDKGGDKKSKKDKKDKKKK